MTRLVLDPEFLEGFPRGGEYLVGVSGGRDSVALVLALCEAGYERLVLCHVNHGLRGEASMADEAFVVEFAARLGIRCEVNRVAKEFYEGGSIEERAREARLEFFGLVAARREAGDGQKRRVILGHHAEDQAETILFHLCRGAGGLRGMSLAQVVGSLELVRPMLKVRRVEIDAFLEECGQGFCEDASNASGEFTRNRLRHEALPLLGEVMGRDVVPQMTRALQVSAQEGEAMDAYLGTLGLYDPQGRLFLPKLSALPVGFQRRVILDYLKAEGIKSIDGATVERCLVLLDEKEKVAKVNLPGGHFLRRKEKRVFTD